MVSALDETTDEAAPVEPERRPEHRSVGSRAARGTAITLAAFLGANLVRLGGNVVLTRLLPQEAFGLMALVSAFLLGLHLFSDVGIGPSIIQNERGDDLDFLNTAWTMQVGRGLSLFAICCVAAMPFAAFYEEEQLALLIPFAGLSALAMGFASTRVWTANRHLAMGRIMALDVMGQVMALVVMIAWAWVHPTVWALAVGGLFSQVAKTVLSYTFLPGERNRFRWDRSAARSLIRFGRWIFLSTVLTFLVMESDRLIFGKLISMAELGVYHIALTIAMLPTMAVGSFTGRVGFPLYSRALAAGGEMQPLVRRIRWVVLVAGGWAATGLVAGGPTAIRLLYDARYVEAGWILQLLGVGAWFACLSEVNGSVVLAQGRAYWTASANGVKLGAMAALIPLGYLQLGFPGAILGLVGADFLRYVASAYAARRTGLAGLDQDLGLTLTAALVAVLARFAAMELEASGAHVTVEALAVAALVTLLFSPFIWPIVRRMRKEGASSLFRFEEDEAAVAS